MSLMTIAQELKARTYQPGQGRFALVIQGGGMRGIYSLGALAALESAGLTSAFDLVLGSSAGAINGAYFLAGQANEAINVYVEDLSTSEFINPFRINKIVDIDFLVDEVLKKRYPLNTEALLDSPTELHVVLTDAETAEPISVTNRERNLDFYEVLRATSAMPVLYDRRVRVGSREYVDGGIVDALPITRALTAGANTILAVVTRTRGFRALANRTNRVLGGLIALRQTTAIKNILGHDDGRFNEAMELLKGVRPRPAGLRTKAVWPGDKERLVTRATRDRRRLRECAEMGRADMQAILKQTWDGHETARVA